MADQKNIAYFNTLIFTIITGVVSLALLALLLLDFGKHIVYFIIIFEIGVFFIIATCIYYIIAAELRKKENAQNILIKFDKCPDLWSKVSYSNEDYCMNWSLTRDAYGNSFVARLYPLQDGNGRVVAPDSSFTSNSMIPTGFTSHSYKTVKPSEFASEPKFVTMTDRCQALFTRPPATSSNNRYDDMSVIPWTHARSRCASLASTI